MRRGEGNMNETTKRDCTQRRTPRAGEAPLEAEDELHVSAAEPGTVQLYAGTQEEADVF